MPIEPLEKRTFVFVDGQNLFHAVREAYGYSYPNYDVKKLAESLCRQRGWQLAQIYFYTGVPAVNDNPFWHHFWQAKLQVMGTRGIHSFVRPLRYRNESIRLSDGTETTVLVGREKGIDVRLALDVVRLAREARYDVAVVFSQDQDLSEVADEIKAISQQQERWIKMVSAYPVSPTYGNTRGINGTEWFRLERAHYERCIDPRDYRVSGR